MILKKDLKCKWINRERGESTLQNQLIPHEQEYHHHLMQKYKEITVNYEELKSNAGKVFHDNIHNEIYKEKLGLFVDDISVNEEYQELFSKYEFDKKKAITQYIKLGNFNEKKVEKLFSVRLRGLKRKTENLNADNIGTALNTIKDFYNDLFLDVERNRYHLKDGNKTLWVNIFNQRDEVTEHYRLKNHLPTLDENNVEYQINIKHK